MPSFVPRSLEPYQKRSSYDSRLLALRGAINAGASAVRIASAAEKLRQAALAVIKARRYLLASQPSQLTLPADHPEVAGVARQIDNLRQDEARWRALTVAGIVSLAKESDTESDAGADHQDPRAL